MNLVRIKTNNQLDNFNQQYTFRYVITYYVGKMPRQSSDPQLEWIHIVCERIMSCETRVSNTDTGRELKISFFF